MKENLINGFNAVLFLLVIGFEFSSDLVGQDCNNLFSHFRQIFLTLSYSYIAAAIFQYIVVQIPYDRKRKSLSSLFLREMSFIRERLRLSREVVKPFTFDTAPLSDSDYIKLFEEVDMYDKAFMSNLSKNDVLQEYRKEIDNRIVLLLSFREYLDDKQFALIIALSDSYFMSSDFLFPHEECPSIYDNRKMIGESICEQYDKIKTYLSELEH